jgi:hypothetical protein
LSKFCPKKVLVTGEDSQAKFQVLEATAGATGKQGETATLPKQSGAGWELN